eukprot:6461766-Pyramimonas_sp.AAC.1
MGQPAGVVHLGGPMCAYPAVPIGALGVWARRHGDKPRVEGRGDLIETREVQMRRNARPVCSGLLEKK